MSIVNALIKETPIPRMIPVEQHFERNTIVDIEGSIRKAVDEEGVLDQIYAGMSIAVTAGSRGISNIPIVIRTVVRMLKDKGANPFVIPAMGSHGGATAEGQLAILESLGITEESVSCPIHSSMEVRKIGVTFDGCPVQIDAFAAEADGIVVVNRVKAHTSFTGPVESGLMKMMAIGLAKQAGAEVCHQEGYAKISQNILKYGKAILSQANILFGVALIENAFDDICEIHAVRPQDFERTETKLLKRSKELLPRILFSNLDVLVVDKMGKNISGLGMDPHITGCFASPYASGPPRPDKLVVLDLTEESHGNANGIGVADVTTRRLFDKFDPEATYPNALTATLTAAVRIPLVMDNQRLAIQTGIKTAAGFDKKNIRLVRIPDTLSLNKIWISEALYREAADTQGITVLGGPEYMDFDEEGNLF
ncbi:MAG TPA: DUF362 domain-containing protein [Candidatus Dorea gallistercoris]|uniref:DUF362 domain-containing protein n=1 Tax=Candidatus Dorea gallistercoris TaxID=2838542 RepID=A0A9D1UEB6_9FIRM|nr:DUF362 domain-containing protein [Candidatus Dorea gallistercoris]